MEPLVRALSNPDWAEKIDKLGRELVRPKIMNLEDVEDQPQCACGCGKPVRLGRSFINRTHQLDWLHGEGGLRLARARWS
jgi:hypothetical protein